MFSYSIYLNGNQASLTNSQKASLLLALECVCLRESAAEIGPSNWPILHSRTISQRRDALANVERRKYNIDIPFYNLSTGAP